MIEQDTQFYSQVTDTFILSNAKMLEVTPVHTYTKNEEIYP